MKTMMKIGIATIQTTSKSAAIGASILILFCLVLLSAGCGVLETETIENSLRVDAEATIEVDTGKGFIRIEAGPTGGIDVTAELRDAENVEYSVTRTGDTITVRARTRSWGTEADITVTVPENTAYALNTGNGAIHVVGLTADGTATSGNGSITLEEMTGRVRINTGNGPIVVTDYSGDMGMNTGNGSIDVQVASGSFNLNSGNGEISLVGAEGAFQLNSGNGPITVEAKFAQGSSSSLVSGHGKVTVAFVGTPSVRLDLETKKKGEIRHNLDVAVEEESARHLIGTVGGGDSSLRIRTGHGDIVLN